MQVHWVSDASNHLILCRSFLLLPSIFPGLRVFTDESALHIRWPKYWSFNFSISPSNEYSGLISLGLTGLISLQSKGLSRVLSNITVQKHQFFGAQPSFSPTLTSMHDYWKNIALTIQTFVGKVMSLLFNMLSNFSSKEQVSFNFMAVVTIGSDFGAQENTLLLNTLARCIIVFSPRSKRLLISWLQSLSTVTFGGQVCHSFYCFLIYLPWSDETGCHDLGFLNAKF